jgi:hypothetical protein
VITVYIFEEKREFVWKRDTILHGGGVWDLDYRQHFFLSK